MTSSLAGGLAAIALLASTAAADTVIFKDGRVFEVPKLAEGQKGLEAQYRHGAIPIDPALVKEWFSLGAGGEYLPKTDEEKKQVEAGMVPFEGRWIAKAARDRTIAERSTKAQARIDEFKKHQEWRDRYKGATKHFEFEYTVPPEISQRYMEMFEVYYDVFATQWKVSQPKGAKLKVCFYNNFEDYTRIGNAPGSLGYFRFVEPIELNFFYSRRDERLTLDVLFHELNHYLFHLYADPTIQMPAWCNEGMAEYFGASEWDPKTKKMKLGCIQEGRLVNLIDAMDGDEMQSLKGLMSEPRIDALQYAWSWTLCHMLMENPATRDKFKAYVAKVAKDKKLANEPYPANSNYTWVPPSRSIELFQKTLGIKDLDAFQQEWYAYIRKLKVESARGYYRAAMTCVQWDRPLRAISYLEKAVDLGTSDPGVYVELGKLYVRDQKPEKAIAAFERGIQLDPLNADMHLQLGKAHMKRTAEGSQEKGIEEQLLAVEIDPNDGELIWGLDPGVLEKVGH